ncbi:HlyC/CorC family transporter [Candidatus Woesearchaeota archaeon]|nr:HlyC/CorC family transporter [Candidatus Woesearchaeota archaeon]
MNLWIIFVICVMLSAFFSAAEIAIFSLGRYKLKTLVKQKIPEAETLSRIKSDPQKLITTILIGNNIVNVTASTIMAYEITKITGSSGIGLATGITTFILLLFGEVTPKSFAALHAESFALKSAKPIAFFEKLFFPLVFIFNGIAKALLTLSGKKIEPQKLSGDELKALFEAGAEDSNLPKKQKELIERAFKFGDITAGEIMTSRMNMASLDAELRLKDIMGVIIKSQFSRMPLYKKNKDNIVGILFVKDLLPLLEKGKTNILLSKVARKPFFVPKYKPINELFKEFQEKGVHMAIVVDDFGGTAGVITLEDLLEELVGEIIDEGDISERVIMRVDKNTIIVDGSTQINFITNFFNISLPGKTGETISGLILKKLKRIPKEGDSIEFEQDIECVIEKASKKRILKVLIKKKGKA